MCACTHEQPPRAANGTSESRPDRTDGRAETTYRRRFNLGSSVGSRHMRFRHLLLSLAFALIVAGLLPARADAAVAKDVATIGDCLRK
jgi:hypothetical protein